MKKLLLSIGLIVSVSASAQTNNSTTFFNSVTSYFTGFNTNLLTFQNEKGSMFTSVDSIQGGEHPLANSVGLSYKIYKVVGAETLFRNTGTTGVFLEAQAGLNLNFVLWDTKVTPYVDCGYAFAEPTEKIYAEPGVRVQKALTDHTYAGVGLGVQLPVNRQVFSVFAGFTF